MFHNDSRSNNRGFNLLDVQIAFAVLGIALGGLVPTAVAQIRLMNRIEKRMSLSQVHYLIPSTQSWARKFGVAASASLTDPGSLPEATPVVAANRLSVVSFTSSILNDSAQATITVTPAPPEEE